MSDEDYCSFGGGFLILLEYTRLKGFGVHVHVSGDRYIRRYLEIDTYVDIQRYCRYPEIL